MPRLSRAVIYIHGPMDADRIIPFELGRKLFDAANEPKQFVAVRGGGHNNLPSAEFARALDQFFSSLPR